LQQIFSRLNFLLNFAKENPKKLIVENLPIINKTKHSTKGREKGTRWKDPSTCKRITLQMKSLQTENWDKIKYRTSAPQIARSILDKERGGIFENMLSLKNKTIAYNSNMLQNRCHKPLLQWH
jgi:hypothetical protein